MDTSSGKAIIIVPEADAWVEVDGYRFKVQRAVLLERTGHLPITISTARLNTVTPCDIEQYLYYIHMAECRPQRLRDNWSQVLVGAQLFNDSCFYNELEEFIEFSLDSITLEDWKVVKGCRRVFEIFRRKLDAGTLLSMLSLPEGGPDNIHSFLATVEIFRYNQIVEYTERIYALEQRLKATFKPSAMALLAPEMVAANASCLACTSERALGAPLHTCVPCGYRYTHDAHKCTCRLQEYYTLPVNELNDESSDDEQQRKALANAGDMLTDEQKEELMK